MTQNNEHNENCHRTFGCCLVSFTTIDGQHVFKNELHVFSFFKNLAL